MEITALKIRAEGYISGQYPEHAVRRPGTCKHSWAVTRLCASPFAKLFCHFPMSILVLICFIAMVIDYLLRTYSISSLYVVDNLVQEKKCIRLFVSYIIFYHNFQLSVVKPAPPVTAARNTMLSMVMVSSQELVLLFQPWLLHITFNTHLSMGIMQKASSKGQISLITL